MMDDVTYGSVGNHVLNNYVQDEHTSADTRAWLNDFTQSAKVTSFKRRVKPTETPSIV